MCTDQQLAKLTGVFSLVGRMARIICAVTIGLALALGQIQVAWAEDAPELPESASLMLRLGYTSKGVTKYIDGAQVSIYKVADLDDNINFYTTLDAFKSLDVDFNKGLDANVAQKVADQAAAIVTKNKIKAVATATSSAQGTISYGTLPYGVYLCVQTGAQGTAKDYYDFDPFLISVPSLEEDRIVYNVVTEPKTSPRPVTPVPPTKPPLAKTGDTTNIQQWIPYFCMGLALLIMGIALRKHKLAQQ